MPTESTLSFVPVQEKADPVLNVAIGGHYLLSKRFRIHAGFFTDASPVADPDSSDFRTVDLVGASAGCLLQLDAPLRFSGSRRLLGHDRQPHRWSLPGWDRGQHQDQSQHLYHALCDFVRVLIT